MTYNTRDLTNQWSNSITGGGGPPIMPDIRRMTDQQLQSLQNWSEGAKKSADSFGSLGSGVEAAGRAGAAVLKELLKHRFLWLRCGNCDSRQTALQFEHRAFGANGPVRTVETTTMLRRSFSEPVTRAMRSILCPECRPCGNLLS
jgi:hypothetical protein